MNLKEKIFDFTIEDLKWTIEEHYKEKISNENLIAFANFLNNAEGIQEEINNHIQYFMHEFINE